LHLEHLINPWSWALERWLVLLVHKVVESLTELSHLDGRPLALDTETATKFALILRYQIILLAYTHFMCGIPGK
jgi:hypothetical protein